MFHWPKINLVDYEYTTIYIKSADGILVKLRSLAPPYRYYTFIVSMEEKCLVFLPATDEYKNAKYLLNFLTNLSPECLKNDVFYHFGWVDSPYKKGIKVQYD